MFDDNEMEKRLNGPSRLLLLILVAAPSVAPATQAQSELDSFLEAYTFVWNEHDGQSLARFFTDDADLIMGSALNKHPAQLGRHATSDVTLLRTARRATFADEA